ncbi:hypothetical protein SP90_07960 [Halodesulfovibrio spirochaetisodalis]|uniref:DUF1240 domain-containing protein n=2 Tax=Halodesulfovibrio spirochaetisodalis TaxID=1560234 RepID=A0A1B7XDJ5_9BACT|nr:hypothetical protein SP90_07960 [Halodesulfovibrio spirochaetisodalis]
MAGFKLVKPELCGCLLNLFVVFPITTLVSYNALADVYAIYTEQEVVTYNLATCLWAVVAFMCAPIAAGSLWYVVTRQECSVAFHNVITRVFVIFFSVGLVSSVVFNFWVTDYLEEKGYMHCEKRITGPSMKKYVKYEYLCR